MLNHHLIYRQPNLYQICQEFIRFATATPFKTILIIIQIRPT